MLNGRVAARSSRSGSALGFTDADVRAAAGQQSFERGVSYLSAVTSLEIFGSQVIASVRGSDDYLVVLTLGDEAAGGARPRAECGCPYGQEGFFCKHCVAVALTLLRDAARVPAQRSRRAGDPRGEAGHPDVGSWLGALSREELIAIVCEQAIEDDDWRRRLELRAATAAADAAGVMARSANLLLRDDALGSRLTGPYGYLEGQECLNYARRIEEVTAAVQDLADGGHAADAAQIAEMALAAVAEVSGHASDRAGVITDAAQELVAAHAHACRAGAADPAGLADFLAARMVGANEIPEIDLADYWELLGEAGVARLRERVTTAWMANRSGWPERLAMERVLTAVGDVDALVDVLSAYLDDRGLTHLRITALLDEAGRRDEALQWAERGVREPAEPDLRLADFVVERYCAAGRIDDALSVRRDRFRASRSVASYRALREVAEQARVWEATRQWALDVLRADAATARQPARWSPWVCGPVLIDVLIADGDIDAAWESADLIASDAQWLRLADLVAETRPADALAVYRRQIGTLRNQTGEQVYARMASLLDAARECHRRLGTTGEFAAYLQAFRSEQKRKRALIRILDAHQL
jgi:hypothetical protein